MPVICPGCGEPLPPPRTRGRPAVYHGAACRQRARRSRVAAGPAAAGVLDALRRVDEASAAARRAVLAGGDAGPTIGELIAAVAAITPTARATPALDPIPARDAATGDRVPVDRSEPVARPAAPARPRQAVPRSPESAGANRPVTKSVTDGGAIPRYAARRDVIDSATVRLGKSTRFAIDGNYLVVAGTREDPVLVGFVRQRGFGSTWEAQIGGHGTALPDGPWKTRKQATANLLHVASKVLGYTLR